MQKKKKEKGKKHILMTNNRENLKKGAPADSHSKVS